MSTEAQGAAGDNSALPRQSEPPLPAAPEASAEAPPTGQVIIDTWAEAADASGTVKATRKMPEPDSLGG